MMMMMMMQPPLWQLQHHGNWGDPLGILKFESQREILQR
jgi:hypothetical protein